MTFNILIVIVQCTMLWCIANVLQRAEAVTISLENNKNFEVFIARFGCAVALNLKCIPEFAKSLKLMKFVNNNPDEFRQSRIPFIIGLTQFLVNVGAETINVLYLMVFDNVFDCIIHFINMSVIMEVSNIYYSSLMSNELK